MAATSSPLMFDQFAALKQKALQHLDMAAAFARKEHQPQLADRIEEGSRKFASNRYNIALVGNMKRGKSTLLNTLLGRTDDHLSPVASKVCTAAIIQYLSREAHPEKATEAQVFFEGKSDPLRVPIEALRDYITDENNPGNEKKVRSVDVFGDFPLLHNVVTIVDTPGRGAVQRHHEVLLEEFLPQADAIIFLIAADLPIEASESAFLKQLSDTERERIFFVLTKRDEVPARDLPEVRKWVNNQIREAGLHCDRLFEVSARDLFEARCSRKDADEIARLHRESGVAELEAELERFMIAKSGKNSLMLPNLRLLLDEVANLSKTVEIEAEHDLSVLNADAGQNARALSDLQSDSATLRSDRDKALGKFRRSWNTEIAAFRRKLAARSGAISDRILDRVNRGGFLAVAFSAFQIKSMVGTALRQEVDALLPSLDERLATVTDVLASDIETGWETYQRSLPATPLLLPGVAALGMGLTGTAIASAVTQIGAAVTAATAASAAPTWPGLMPLVKFWLAGSATAKTAAITAASTAVVPAVTAVAISVATTFLSKHIILAVQENRVPALVDETVEETGSDVEAKLHERCEEIVRIYHDGINEQIERTEERHRELQEAIASRDPLAKPALEARLADARRLQHSQGDLDHNMRLLS